MEEVDSKIFCAPAGTAVKNNDGQIIHSDALTLKRSLGIFVTCRQYFTPRKAQSRCSGHLDQTIRWAQGSAIVEPVLHSYYIEEANVLIER